VDCSQKLAQYTLFRITCFRLGGHSYYCEFDVNSAGPAKDIILGNYYDQCYMSRSNATLFDYPPDKSP
jgi:hypothetical protein